jgi:hypothetical protein
VKTPRLPFLFCVLPFVLPASVRAQSELDKPYKLHIVVHVAQNRLLTDVFRDRIERELRDGFQGALGDMGRVTVSHEHPRLDDVLARGLRSLDGWKDRSDGKTHFVLIDYADGHYEIRARQYDGTIGRPSPVVRRDRTRDRDFVAKAAALLLKQDFGILGIVQEGPIGAKKLVKVELRGAALGDLARWVKKDDVFALVPPEGGASRALRWSLLQVEQAPAEGGRDGVCQCRFFHRYRIPNIVGYRCIKLGTVQTPLRLRWVQDVSNDAKGKPLTLRLTVEVRRYGFDGEEATKLQKRTDQNGVLETIREGQDGVFANVAFVSVLDGMKDPKPQVPIPLVDDQPVFIEVLATEDKNILLTASVTTWRNKVADSSQMQGSLFKRLQGLGAKADKREEVIREAERGLRQSREDRLNLLKEREELVKKAREERIELKTPREDKRLADLAEGEGVLQQFIAVQKNIEETENDPQKKKWLSAVENAKLLEKELEIGKAIAIYESVKQEGLTDAGLDKHLEKLRKQWKIANPEHEQARNYIYRVWPTLDSDSLKDGIDKARKALKKCQDAGDFITIHKLLNGTLDHADRLKKEGAELHPTVIPDDVEPAKRLAEISEQISRLGLDIVEYEKTHTPDK